jgi:hypothetical protein
MDYPETIKIVLNLGNDAFCEPEHVVNTLRRLANDLELDGWDNLPNKLRDVNGNTVGTVEVIP